jgi:hypothetical protein
MGLKARTFFFFREENVSLISFPCRNWNPMLSSSPSVQCGMEGNFAKRSSTSVFTWSATECIDIAVIIPGHSTNIRNCCYSRANEIRVTILNCYSLAVNCQSLVCRPAGIATVQCYCHHDFVLFLSRTPATLKRSGTYRAGGWVYRPSRSGRVRKVPLHRRSSPGPSIP